MKPFFSQLGSRPLFLDGALGTLLQQGGLKPGQAPELWNLSHPDAIRAIHDAYRDAGADILLANTFGANRIKLGQTEDSCALIRAGIALAKQSAQERAYVALDIGPTGKLLCPYGDLPFEDACAAYAEVVEAGTAAGADLLVIETMSDLYETKAALLAAKEHSTLPVLVSLTFDENGKLLTGADIPTAAAVVEGLGADIIAMNCGLGPRQMLALLPLLRRSTSLPIAVSPNAGLPTVVDGKTEYHVAAESFAESCSALIQGGAAITGGCCGTTPEHISAMVKQCSLLPIRAPEAQMQTVVSSFTHTVAFGAQPLLIGERLNPTGKARLKQALRSGDMDYLCREACCQSDGGAHILDINVGLPEIDEVSMLSKAVCAVQSVCDLPLQLDSSDSAALAAALRLYNGRPLINSVNASRKSMDSIFPLAKKYGAAVVALTLDENGIPDTAAARVALAEKILKEAEQYGLSKKDLIVDPLAMTVSTDAANADTALTALDEIRHRLGMNTVLGVSNISFGLPHREMLNASFFLLAMEHGLSAGIVNPGDRAIQDAYHTYCALRGLDSNFSNYISYCSDFVAPPDTPLSQQSLRQSVLRGLTADSAALARNLLAEKSPLEIIDSELIPALDEVGAGFEKGTLFLPQLLMSADAAKAAFDVLRAKLQESGSENISKGRVLLATVQGDVHDIGKNIVKTLLENYGFSILDLGKDAAPEMIAETAEKEQLRLVGLSALMTTTVPAMEQAIRLVHQRVPGCRVMVGGAVLNEEYAAAIGADFYSKDAMGSVRYAESILGGK